MDRIDGREAPSRRLLSKIFRGSRTNPPHQIPIEKEHQRGIGGLRKSRQENMRLRSGKSKGESRNSPSTYDGSTLSGTIEPSSGKVQVISHIPKTIQLSVKSAPAILTSPESKQSVKSAPTVLIQGSSGSITEKTPSNDFDHSRPRVKRASSMSNVKWNDPKNLSPPGLCRRSKSSYMGRSLSKRSSVSSGKHDDFKSVTSQDLLRRRKSLDIKSCVRVPSGNITLVYTDIQNSTALWELYPVAMKEALDLHDSIVRRCYSDHNGYEITTEGDAFHLAFQHPLDALSFCLQAQDDLYFADWSETILSSEYAKEERTKAFRGPRVRMALHHGPTTSYIHKVTGRVLYKGEAVSIGKSLESMCHGGQILTTVETWREVSGMAERYLGSPQVVDCGEHIILGKQTEGQRGGLTSKRILQLLPKQFAFDFFEARGDKQEEETRYNFGECIIKTVEDRKGREFPNLNTKGQISASFFDAPFAHNRATICFVYTVESLHHLSDRCKTKNASVLAKLIRSLLVSSDPPGYECQEGNGSWMLAFNSTFQAVDFGLRLIDELEDAPLKVKVGVHSGRFISMGPHKITGRADYFGPIVNRAARVASASRVGDVSVGYALETGDEVVPPDFGSGVDVQLSGKHKYKGISVEMITFSCCRSS